MDDAHLRHAYPTVPLSVGAQEELFSRHVAPHREWRAVRGEALSEYYSRQRVLLQATLLGNAYVRTGFAWLNGSSICATLCSHRQSDFNRWFGNIWI